MLPVKIKLPPVVKIAGLVTVTDLPTAMRLLPCKFKVPAVTLTLPNGFKAVLLVVDTLLVLSLKLTVMLFKLPLVGNNSGVLVIVLEPV